MDLQLRAPGFDFWVDVSLRHYGRRWMAVAHIAGELELGLGYSSHVALEAALSALGTEAAQAFLADPHLLASCRFPGR